MHGAYRAPPERRVHDAVAAIDGHFMQLRTGQSFKFVADSQRGQKRNVAGAYAGTADLAPRETLLFNQRHRPSGQASKIAAVLPAGPAPTAIAS